MKSEATDLAARGVPPALVAGGHYILGISLPDWVTILTIVWLVIVIGEKLYQIWLRHRHPKHYRRRRTD